MPGRATDERTFTVINAARGLADNSAQVVVCSPNGRMIVSTLGNINFYDGAYFNNIVTRREYNYPLSQYRGNYKLCFDNRHHLWYKNVGSMTCTSLTMEQFTQNVDSVLRDMGCDMPVHDLFTDFMGHVWTLSTEGLYGVEQQQTYTVLRDRNLQDVDVFDNMLLTFYDNGEEMAQDLTTGNTLHRTRAYEWDTALRYSNSSALMRHGDGYFQIRNGDRESVLLFFDVRQQQWTTIMEMPMHMNYLAKNGDKLYIATQQGYCIYDPQTGTTTWKRELTLNSGEKISPDVKTMAFDRQGGLWVGTERRGLLYSKPFASPFRALPREMPEAKAYVEQMQGLTQNITEFQGMNANCMFTDSRGWSWIGTTTGLYMYKDPHQKPMVFTRKTGFYNDVIHSVVEDAEHNIWVATSAGISFIRFRGEEVVFVNSFDTNDEVPSESFINNKAMLLPDSQVVMQAIDHVIAFKPSAIKIANTPQPYKLLPKLSKLMVNGINVEANEPIDGNIVVDRAVTSAEVINLKSNQTTLALTFSALNYFRPLQTYYRVRLKGKGDERWNTYSYFNSDYVDGRGILHLQIFDLEPGKYTLEMQASLYPDMWDGEPFSWQIVVNQSWWQAKGMYYAYAGLLLLLAIINLVLYVRNMRMRVHRNHEEGDIISKICVFVERADGMEQEKLAPLADGYGSATDQHLSTEFIDVMQKVMPLVRESRKETLTMHRLSEMADVDVVKLYETVTENIYKSPRDMIRKLRLRKAEELLAGTDMAIEQISDECGFYTPNYLMGNFFHEHKQTPREYREDRRQHSKKTTDNKQ